MRTGAEIIAEREAKRRADGWATVADVVTALPKLDRPTLERVAVLFSESVGLDEHNPNGEDVIAPYACSDDTYHLCSFSGRHTGWCVLGQDPPEGSSPVTRRCPPGCETSESAEPWCHAAGFGCRDCKIVAELTEIVRREAHAGNP